MNLAKTIQKSETTGGNSPAKVFFQPKLAINLPGDQYENEADAIAQQVMRKPGSENLTPFFQPKPIPVTLVQRKCAACKTEEKLQEKEEDEKQMWGLETSGEFSIQRKCDQCEEEESVQMKGGIHATEAARDLHTVEHVVNTSGSPLEKDTRQFMESRFGYDFSGVQVHDDVAAHQSAAGINALAYTHKNHLVFGKGQYQPTTTYGRELLAHELVHVVQQSQGSTSIVQKKDPPAVGGVPKQHTGDLVLSGYFPFLQSALDKVTLKKIGKVYDNYEEAVGILARTAMVSSGEERYRLIGEVYTPAVDDAEEWRALRLKKYVVANSVLQIPSERFFAPEDLQIDEKSQPELFGFIEYFLQTQITILLHPEQAALFPERAIEYYWQGLPLMMEYQTKQGKLLLDKLAGWVKFTSLPKNELLATGVDQLNAAFQEHMGGYTTALDNLEVFGLSVTAELISVDWQALLQMDHEIRKLKLVYGDTAVDASIKRYDLEQEWKKKLKSDFGLMKFQGESVYEGPVANEALDDPETGVPYEIVEVLKVVDSLNQLITLLSKSSLNYIEYLNVGVQFFAQSGRPINIFFKRKVLQKKGLWHKLELYYSSEENLRREEKNTELFGPFIDVGKFDLDTVYELLDTGLTDWMVTGKEAGKILEMMTEATPKGREKILWMMMEKNIDYDFLSNLPYKAVEALANSINDTTLKSLLGIYYIGKGGGESAAAMLDRVGVEQAAKGNYVRSYLVAFLHTAWNATSGGFLNTYSEAYDLRQQGLISGNDLTIVAAKATFRTAAVLAISALTGGTASGATTGGLMRLGISKPVAGFFGNLAGGVGGGLADQFTFDLVSMSLLDQKGFSPGMSYLMAAGIGGGLSLVGSAAAKWKPESAQRMAEIYNERHPWLTKLVEKSQQAFAAPEPAIVAYGKLPNGVKIVVETPDYVVYQTAGGKLRIRFRAAAAVTLKEANPGRNYTTDTQVALDEEGRPFVHEGRHRAIGAAKGDKILASNGGVDDAPGWLDFDFSPEVVKEKGVPVKDLSIDYTDPDVPPDEADAIWEKRHGSSSNEPPVAKQVINTDKILKPEEATGEGYLTPDEVKELQAIANKYKTTFYVVGSRAEGRGRNIFRTDLPVGKDSPGVTTRSDIDVRIDSEVDINSRGGLSNDIANVSNGAGKSMVLIGKQANAPAIEFKPK